jgi:hypothetical protein
VFDGLIEGWVAKLAALYFESRHPSKFLMGDISKGVAKPNAQKYTKK